MGFLLINPFIKKEIYFFNQFIKYFVQLYYLIWNKRTEKPTSLTPNPYCVDKSYSGEVLAFLEELIAEMKGERYFNESDPMTDYFHCSHYIDIDVGNWEKPYIYNQELAQAA